jgi:RNA polymerase sigma-70 factor (ECF subfamily)
VEVTEAELRAAAGAADRGELAGLLDPVAAAAAGGDRAAVELLVWAVDELALARPALRRVLIDEDDVDDVAQDVLVAVVEGIHGFRGDARFTTWLHRVARFKAIDHLRRKREHALLREDEQGDGQRISSVLASRADLRGVLAGLPEHYRRAVVLRDVEQLPYADVAARLGLNLNTVKSHVARGRALVAAELAAR